MSVTQLFLTGKGKGRNSGNGGNAEMAILTNWGGGGLGQLRLPQFRPWDC